MDTIRQLIGKIVKTDYHIKEDRYNQQMVLLPYSSTNAKYKYNNNNNMDKKNMGSNNNNRGNIQ